MYRERVLQMKEFSHIQRYKMSKTREKQAQELQVRVPMPIPYTLSLLRSILTGDLWCVGPQIKLDKQGLTLEYDDVMEMILTADDNGDGEFSADETEHLTQLAEVRLSPSLKTNQSTGN